MSERHIPVLLIEVVDAFGRQQVDHVAEATFDQTQPRRIALGERTAGADGVGITIDGNHLAVGAIEHGRGVAAGTEGAVDIAAAIARLQGVDHFVQQDGDVTVAHASPPPRPRTKAAILSRSESRRACQRPGFHS